MRGVLRLLRVWADTGNQAAQGVDERGVAHCSAVALKVHHFAEGIACNLPGKPDGADWFVG